MRERLKEITIKRKILKNLVVYLIIEELIQQNYLNKDVWR